MTAVPRRPDDQAAALRTARATLPRRLGLAPHELQPLLVRALLRRTLRDRGLDPDLAGPTGPPALEASFAAWPAPIPLELPGLAHETRPDPDGRRRSAGAWYTPPALAADLVARVLARSPADPASLRLLDPACGSGAFLVAWLRAVPGTDPLERTRGLHGVDLDGEALNLCGFALALAAVERLAPTERPLIFPTVLASLQSRLVTGNALVWPGPDAPAGAVDLTMAFPEPLRTGGFDVVLGNPPWVDSGTMTRERLAERTWLAGSTGAGRRYRTARGNWDLSCVFVERGLQLCRPGGTLALLVPNKLASADFAAGVRELLDSEARRLEVTDHSRAHGFAADTYPISVVAERGRPTVAASSGPWPLLARPEAAAIVRRLRRSFPALGELAEVRGAATVAEAYALKPLVFEDASDPGALRIVNSGTIDPFTSLWGRRPLRYLGRTYERPVVPRALEDRLPPTRRLQSRSPKLVVAGLSRRLECLRDPDGTLLAAKSTALVLAGPGLLVLLLGLLHSDVVDGLVRHLFAGNALSGGYLRLGPPQLRVLPIALPPGDEAHSFTRSVLARESGTALPPAVEAAIAAAYGLDPAEQAALGPEVT